MYKKECSSTTSYNSSKEVPWGIFDIALIFFLTCTCLAILICTVLFAINTETVSYRVFRYIAPVIFILIPYLWLKKRYHITFRLIGVTKGKYSFFIHIILGLTCTSLIYLTIKTLPFWYDLVLQNNSISINNIMSIIIFPFTLFGFATIILTPFAEEIFFRGIVYQYFAQKIGLYRGLICQAVFATMTHFSQFLDSLQSNYFFSWLSYMIIMQTIFGLLYVKTHSIYSATICHALINYLIFLYSFKPM